MLRILIFTIILGTAFSAAAQPARETPVPAAPTVGQPAPGADQPTAEPVDGDDLAIVGNRNLILAANSAIPLSTSRLSTLGSAMTDLLTRPDYPAGRNTDGTAYPEDIGCAGVTFTIDRGSIVADRRLPSIFVSDTPGFDWDAFTSIVRADFYIVNSITCGAVVGAAGCAPLRGNSRVVTAGSGLAPIPMVHEIGHTRGLTHSNGNGACPADFRTSREGDYRRIMYCRAIPLARGINEAECRAFGGLPIPAPFAVVADAGSAPLDDVLLGILSIPYDDGNTLNPGIAGLMDAQIDAVRTLFADPTEIDLLRGAVVVLQERGSLADAFLLLSFFDNPTLPEDPLVVEAKLAVLPAVSAIARREDDVSLLTQVVARADPERARTALGYAAESAGVQAVLGLSQAGNLALPVLDALAGREPQTGSTNAIERNLANDSGDLAVIDAFRRDVIVDPAIIDAARTLAVGRGG